MPFSTGETMRQTLYVAALIVSATSLVAFAEDTNTAAAAAPTDPEIAHIAVTANQVDIDAGKAALKKTQNAKVKEFAKRMIDDHTSVIKQATDLVKKLKVTPKDNATSKSLKSGGDAKKKELAKLKGAEFDKAYIDNEVAYHQAVIDAVDKVLLPNAQNADLKGLLEKVRPALVAHLEHAKTVQTELAGGSSSMSGMDHGDMGKK
jgi:putative membrane protein